MTLTNKLTEGGNKMRLNTKIFIIFLNILFILSPSISAPSDKCAEQNSEQINEGSGSFAQHLMIY
jgi:hypothetical protein